jgi:hypothetical protein
VNSQNFKEPKRESSFSLSLTKFVAIPDFFEEFFRIFSSQIANISKFQSSKSEYGLSKEFQNVQI